MTLELPARQTGDPQPGERRGDFTFTSLLQKGMSANIYLIWHHRYWSAMVCKMLRAEEREDKHWRDLLFLEGKLLQKVAHPGIVRVFELNMEAEQPYLLLEYLPGATARQLLRRKGRFKVQDALRLTMYTASILHHVHRCGFIHRDVKPGNVMLHGGWVKLFDFGVAWPIWDEKPPDKSGTPAYLAPEQCRQQILTPAVDVWASGIFLFELLTGELPFPPGDYHNYEAAPELRYPQLVTPPKSLKEAGRRVPPGLQQVMNRCLAQEPEERYQNMEELLVALDPFCRTKIWPALPGTSSNLPNLSDFLEAQAVFTTVKSSIE